MFPLHNHYSRNSRVKTTIILYVLSIHFLFLRLFFPFVNVIHFWHLFITKEQHIQYLNILFIRLVLTLKNTWCNVVCWIKGRIRCVYFINIIIWMLALNAHLIASIFHKNRFSDKVYASLHSNSESDTPCCVCLSTSCQSKLHRPISAQ